MHMNDFFPDIPKITYEGPDARNPLSFRWYDADAEVEGKPMREHLRFASAYWHTMRNTLADPFGAGTAMMPWDDGTDSLDNAIRRVDVFFEFLDKIGIDWYCFHDRDVAPAGDTIAESRANLEVVIDHLAQRQSDSGKRLLWGTACLFADPMYVHGAATSPHVDVFAHAGAQVRAAIDATHRLGGLGYVFWGGREGYDTLLNTDMSRELDHLAEFLRLSVRYAREIGFTGAFFIEPKPKEPATHQYDFDAATCLNFLRQYDLLDDFSLNIETNHATLAGHSMAHELEVAVSAGALGSIDANMGHPQLGWDTDHFPTDLYLTTMVMRCLLQSGGLSHGGLNFDAKRRRGSFEPIDLFHGHIAGMDAFARGLQIAAAIRADGRVDAMLHDRYQAWSSDLGQRIERGESSLQALEDHALQCGRPNVDSGREELIRSIVNDLMR